MRSFREAIATDAFEKYPDEQAMPLRPPLLHIRASSPCDNERALPYWPLASL
jgi:hypothetical protein